MRKSLVNLSAVTLSVLSWLWRGRAAQAQTAPSKIAAKAATPKGACEGIAVHGWWTIKVGNPDGKLVQQREFENALNPTIGGVLITMNGPFLPAIE
jgi:hypothetical protein